MRWTNLEDGKGTNCLGKDFLKRTLGVNVSEEHLRYQSSQGDHVVMYFERRTYNDHTMWVVQCAVLPVMQTNEIKLTVRPLLTAQGLTKAVESVAASKDLLASHGLGGEAFLQLFYDCGTVVTV